MLGYSYAVSRYNEKYDMQTLGCLVQGMDLEEDERKTILNELSVFATDLDEMMEKKKKMK